MARSHGRRHLPWLKLAVAIVCTELCISTFIANRQAAIYALPDPAKPTRSIGASPVEERQQTWERAFALHYGDTPLWVLSWPWRRFDLYRWPAQAAQ